LSDVALARAIAAEAGELLLAIRADRDCGARERGIRGDREANQLILDRLHAARPDDFVLSEEACDDRRRCAANRVWVIDPLDGTREFEAGTDDWAVHVGLAIGGAPAIGAVALPACNRLFASDDAPAATTLTPARPRIVASRSRTPAIAQRVATALGGELIMMGSAGAKAMAVVDGSADIYVHDGGQFEWDNCAPVAIARAAGLHASRIDGAPLIYNCENPFLPDLLICRKEWADPVLRAIRGQ